jgi:hypothetical protein
VQPRGLSVSAMAVGISSTNEARIAVPEQNETRIAAPEQPRQASPVVGLAVIGVFFLALAVYVFAHWILSGDATPNTFGRDQAPLRMKITAYALQPVFAISTFWVLWRFLIKPWRATRRLTPDGMLILAMLPLILQDCMSNWLRTAYFTYNTTWLNLGSWTASTPGWISPNGEKLPEPLLYSVPSYPVLLFLTMVAGCALMRRARTRWPKLGNFGLAVGCLIGFMLFDAILEPIAMYFGFWSYPGAIKGLTVFYGHFYQYPIYEGVLFGGMWGAFACLRFFRDDRGNFISDKGLDRVRFSGGGKTTLRVLALIGIMQLMYLSFNFTAGLTTLYNSPWIPDILNRPYLTVGLCGPGTDYSCGGPNTPMPIRGSAHIGTDGRLVAPNPEGLLSDARRP